MDDDCRSLSDTNLWRDYWSGGRMQVPNYSGNIRGPSRPPPGGSSVTGQNARTLQLRYSSVSGGHSDRSSQSRLASFVPWPTGARSEHRYHSLGDGTNPTRAERCLKGRSIARI
jgi:hypothetical protein